MKIEVKGFLIERDQHQYVLSQKLTYITGDKKGDSYFKVLGYYPTESSLLKGLIRYHISDQEVLDSVSKVKSYIDEFAEAFKGRL